MKEFYFSDFESRTPEAPLVHNRGLEFAWQILAIATIGLGLWYIVWRWTSSLNYDALWFSIPVVLAETFSFVGLLLYFNNLWSTNDVKQRPSPKVRSDVVFDDAKRLLSVDVFIPTYTEDPELTRYSIRDAMALRYPHPIDINVFVLDDGNREQMRIVSEEEGAHYLTRSSNIGYKAGNLRNGMERTTGDFIVILDSDTRPFPGLLENTLGYFRDCDVAWVQTPQWFYDIPEGEKLDIVWSRRLGAFGGFMGRTIQRFIGPVVVGEDPFVSDPKLFYDIILRRRNRANASFCCGAGSIHRREAVMEAALKAYSEQVDKTINGFLQAETDVKNRVRYEQNLRHEFAISTEFTPYKFHVSEDIYTSIILQRDTERSWKSVMHPHVESKMLSPLDMHSWAMQRFKYAGGTLDIMRNDNPLFRKGMSLEQKLMYAMTFWSYLSPLWISIFIMAPIFALITGIAPVSAYSMDFFLHLIPFLIVHELATVLGTWGVDNRKGRMLNIAFFSFNIQALCAVMRGREIKFQVTPKERKSERYVHLVWPQIFIVLATVFAILFAGLNHLIEPNPTKLAALVVNGFWASLNAYAMTVLIAAALWHPVEKTLTQIDVKNRRQFWRTS